MALRDLSIGQMTQISKVWLETEENLDVLRGQPKLKPWLPDIKSAHTELRKQQIIRSGVDTALANVKKAQETSDGTHNRRLRGTWTLLDALEMLAPELGYPPGLFAALQTELFPGGLTMILRSYADKAAEATSAPKRLSPPSKKLLSLHIGALDLSGVVDTWLDSATEIDALEGQRNALVGNTEALKASGSLSAARNAWIKAANALITNIEGLTDPELQAADRARLLAATRRYDDLATRAAGAPPGAVTAPPRASDVTGAAAPAAPAAPAPSASPPTAADTATPRASGTPELGAGNPSIG